MTSAKLCYRCGQENSVSHSIKDCPLLLKVHAVDLKEMFVDEDNCKRCAERIEMMVRDHNRSTLFSNYSSRIAKVRIKGVDELVLCIAPLQQDWKTYRVMYLDSRVVDTLNLFDLHRRGNLFVGSEKVDLKKYLLDAPE